MKLGSLEYQGLQFIRPNNGNILSIAMLFFFLDLVIIYTHCCVIIVLTFFFIHVCSYAMKLGLASQMPCYISFIKNITLYNVFRLWFPFLYSPQCTLHLFSHPDLLSFCLLLENKEASTG